MIDQISHKVKTSEQLSTLKQSLFLFQYPKTKKKNFQLMEYLQNGVNYKQKKQNFQLQKIVQNRYYYLIEKKKQQREFLKPLESHVIHSRKTLIVNRFKSNSSKIDTQIIQQKNSMKLIRPIHSFARHHLPSKSFIINKSIKTETDQSIEGMYVLDLLNKRDRLKTISRVLILKDQQMEFPIQKGIILPQSRKDG